MMFQWKSRYLIAETAVAALFVTATVSFAQQQIPQAPQAQAIPATPPQTFATTPQLRLDIPHSKNPFAAYMPSHVQPADLANSPSIDHLIQDGKLYLSLQDAITLALENNLDIAIARYNLPIAQTDIQRTQAGGFFRGVNAGVVQNTPGAGVGG